MLFFKDAKTQLDYETNSLGEMCVKYITLGFFMMIYEKATVERAS
ncbi:hypothetical protein WAX46_12420 [Bacillus sp. FJAT-53060]|nr:hypothetical protein [Bacillus stratosphericus]